MENHDINLDVLHPIKTIGTLLLLLALDIWAAHTVSDTCSLCYSQSVGNSYFLRNSVGRKTPQIRHSVLNGGLYNWLRSAAALNVYDIT